MAGEQLRGLKLGLEVLEVCSFEVLQEVFGRVLHTLCFGGGRLLLFDVFLLFKNKTLCYQPHLFIPPGRLRSPLPLKIFMSLLVRFLGVFLADFMVSGCHFGRQGRAFDQFIFLKAIGL